MKFTHDGTEYEVAQLVDIIRNESVLHRRSGNAALSIYLDAAAALLSRHERLCEATVDVVFDGPPSHESGRFVEVESLDGRSVRCGEWIERRDGYWALRISAESISTALRGDEAPRG